MKIRNTHGRNVFREVRVTCQWCERSEITMMQCDTGTHQWDCEGCCDKTPHTLEEVDPITSEEQP
jgi:hypothetical protein